MEDDAARTEYPSMLSSLQPSQAVNTLNDRVKRINRINLEIADWLQERRRVEEQYVMGLRRLSQLKAPNSQSELGVFTAPWAKIIDATDTLAHTHHQFAERVERDVEFPLRAFGQRQDSVNMSTMSSNLSTMAKSMDEAQSASDKIGKKGGKVSTQKVDAASTKLESATQQWESQAPYIFESLQALDESRVNQLRDLLTQYQTHEADCAQRRQETSAETLAQVIEVSTEAEILGFSSKTTAGRSRLPTRDSARRVSNAGTQNSVPASTGRSTDQAPPPSQPTPSQSFEQPTYPEPKQEPAKPESKLRRLGTILGGRRRQSVVGGVGQSPQKTSSFPLGRLGSREGRGLTPRGSSGNLQESNRLGALNEGPALPRTPEGGDEDEQPHEGTNGVPPGGNIMDAPVPTGAGVNGTREPVTLSDEPPAPGSVPTTQSQPPVPPTKDAEGFTIPAPVDDPITAAQREAAATGEDADQLFKLNIQNKPIHEEDPEEKQAALSSVANSLKTGPAVRRAGTMRGRRDVRNTIYAPSPTATDGTAESALAGIGAIGVSPSLPTPASTRPPAVAALASETSVAGTSDTQSIRSGNSLGSLTHTKHPELTGPGLNASIIETVSVLFEGGALKNASVTGEIAFVNNTHEDNILKTNETIRINNFPNLEKIGPNRIFVQNTAPDHPDQFTMDVSHLTKTSTAFSYRVFAPDTEPLSLGQNVPLLLNPAWKPQGDKLGLLIQYQLNPAGNFKTPVTLHNIVFVATYDGKANGAQTKPSGTHLKERHLVYWRLGDVTLTPEPQKIVCRILGAEGVEPTAGHVEARWEYAVPDGDIIGSGISISRLEESKGKGRELTEDDPFADDGSHEQTWVDVPLARKLISGKYEGK